MPYNAQVIRILIAAPGDAAEEVKAIVSVISRWNAINGNARRLMLDPMHWETHSYPTSGGSGQFIINKLLLRDADLLVAVFRDTFGSPTADFDSGTEEEVSRHLEAHRKAMIYFCTGKIARKADRAQLDAIEKFKDWCKDKALYWPYSTRRDLEIMFRNHLDLHLQPGAGIATNTSAILAGSNIFEQTGYGYPQMLERVRKTLIIAGPTLRSWLDSAERRQGLIDFLREDPERRLSLVLGETAILRELGPGEKGVESLWVSARELREMRSQLTPDEALRFNVAFDSGAATLSAVFIDPDTPEGVLFFTARWGKDYQPSTRLTGMIERRSNPDLFVQVWNDNIRLIMQHGTAKSLDQFLRENDL
jgi:hypothetical protein